jgi:hypothetical protein
MQTPSRLPAPAPRSPNAPKCFPLPEGCRVLAQQAPSKAPAKPATASKAAPVPPPVRQAPKAATVPYKAANGKTIRVSRLEAGQVADALLRQKGTSLAAVLRANSRGIAPVLYASTLLYRLLRALGVQVIAMLSEADLMPAA